MKRAVFLFILMSTLILSACTGGEIRTQTVTQTQTITQTQTVTQSGNADSTATPSIVTITTTSPPITITTATPSTVTITTTSPPITVTSPPITITTTITTTPPAPAEVFLVTKELSYIVTNKTTSYWYFSWQISVKNMTTQSLTAYIEVHFLDAQGFSLEWTNDIVTFAPQEERTMLGEVMVEASIAPNIVSAIADIEEL